MKLGRKQFTLGSMMIFVALCAVAFAFPEVSIGIFTGLAYLTLLALGFLVLDYMGRRTDSHTKVLEAEKPLVANRMDPSAGREL